MTTALQRYGRDNGEGGLDDHGRRRIDRSRTPPRRNDNCPHRPLAQRRRAPRAPGGLFQRRQPPPRPRDPPQARAGGSPRTRRFPRSTHAHHRDRIAASGRHGRRTGVGLLRLGRQAPARYAPRRHPARGERDRRATRRLRRAARGARRAPRRGRPRLRRVGNPGRRGAQVGGARIGGTAAFAAHRARRGAGDALGDSPGRRRSLRPLLLPRHLGRPGLRRAGPPRRAAPTSTRSPATPRTGSSAGSR